VSARLADLPLRDDLRGRTPYGAPQLPHAAQLNVNENPYGPSPDLLDDLAAAVRAAAVTLNRYPDREAVALRQDLAGYLSESTGVALTTEQLWAANGSNEVLQHICQAFGGPGRTALTFEPSYSMHPLIATGTGMRHVGVPRAADFSVTADVAVAAVREHTPAVTFLTTPNNPTGTVTGLDVVEAVYDATDGILVVDEAYAEFGRGRGYVSAVTLLRGRPRLLVSRTMSKAFALAGARLGYLAADPAVVDALRLVRLPYHLSAVTQAVARTALAHRAELLGTVDAVAAERDRLVAGVRALGVGVVPTLSNFFLFGPFGDPRRVWQDLLDDGVLVRDLSGPALPGLLRVNAGTPDEGDRFLAALAAAVARQAPPGSAAEISPPPGAAATPPAPGTIGATAGAAAGIPAAVAADGGTQA
jgi:histidinol-phosphate aminotransferase